MRDGNGIEFSSPLNVAVVIEGAREARDLILLRVVLEIVLREPVGQFTHLRLLRNVERLRQHLRCNIIQCHQPLQRFGDSSIRNLCLEFTRYLHGMKSKELQQQSGPKHRTYKVVTLERQRGATYVWPFDEDENLPLWL